MVYRDGVSILGMGCMRFPVHPGTKEVDVAATEAMVEYAYRNGVNYFDTAYPYHEGQSQRVIGNALKKYERDSFLLANKLPMWLLTCKEDVRKYFEEQLCVCQVDYFDYYLCHALGKARFEDVKKYEVYEELKALKAEGKIRNLGFSFHDTPGVLEEIVDAYAWDFVQIQLNYWDWEEQDAKRQYEILESRNIPVMIMEPVRGGALADLCEESNRIFKEAEAESSIASWAIRYAMSLPGVRVVLSGMSNMEQVEDNIKTAKDFTPLNEAQRNTIERALEAFKTNHVIPCTGCRYCMDCPAGVDIPGVFKAYNEYALRKQKDNFREAYGKLREKKADAGHCVACGKCKSLCPQSLDIPNLMKEVEALDAETR